MNEKELAAFVARLPEHLRFFFGQPPKGLEAEELIQFTRERCEKVRKHRDELKAHGIAADRFLAEMESTIGNLETASAACEKKEDELLHANADLADAQLNAFRALQKMLAHAEKENPFDPKLEEMREQLEELARQFPKEE